MQPAIDASLVGLELPDVTTVIDGESVVAYLRAIGDQNPAYPRDPTEAQGMPVPPAFAAVYALAPPGRKTGFGIAPQRLVHGEQEIEWRRGVRVGEGITTSTRIADVYSRRSLQFMVIEATARDEAGETVCVSRATILVLPE